MHTITGKRTEKDFLGAVEIPVSSLYGINTHRGRRKFSHVRTYLVRVPGNHTRPCDGEMGCSGC